MEVVSEPAFIEEEVTDLDLIYVNGLRDSITMRPADTYVVTSLEITIDIAQPSESIVITRTNVLSYRLRKRLQRRLVPVTTASTTAPPPTT